MTSHMTRQPQRAHLVPAQMWRLAKSPFMRTAA